MASTPANFRTRVLVTIPFLLVSLGQPNTHEFVVRTRRPQYHAILDMERAEAQSELWKDPKGYYFCNIVTVLPECQGQGVGRALMEEVLSMADKEGRSCYLESSRSEPNIAIYEKFGFRLAREMECRDGDGEKDAIKLYCMLRQPRGGQSQETLGGGNKSAAAETAGTTPEIGQ